MTDYKKYLLSSFRTVHEAAKALNRALEDGTPDDILNKLIKEYDDARAIYEKELLTL